MTRRSPWPATVLELLGPDATLISAAQYDWASATFSGSRHVIAISLSLPDGDAEEPEILDLLPDYDFPLDRQLVADCIVDIGDRYLDADGWHIDLRVEMLTIDIDLD
jgi:hypothetical protein